MLNQFMSITLVVISFVFMLLSPDWTTTHSVFWFLGYAIWWKLDAKDVS